MNETGEPMTFFSAGKLNFSIPSCADNFKMLNSTANPVNQPTGNNTATGVKVNAIPCSLRAILSETPTFAASSVRMNQESI